MWTVHPIIHPEHDDSTAKNAAASATSHLTSWAMASAGATGLGGPTPRHSLRTIFSTLWASAAMYPSQSTFHSPRNRDFSHPNRSSEAKAPSAMVLRRLLSRRAAAVRFRSRALAYWG